MGPRSKELDVVEIGRKELAEEDKDAAADDTDGPAAGSVTFQTMI